MKVRIDRDADVLWIEWGDLIDSYADEVSKNVYLHYTPQGGPVAYCAGLDRYSICASPRDAGTLYWKCFS